MAFGGGFWKGRFVPSSAFLRPQGGVQIEEKAHLQAALLTQSLGTLGQKQGSHHSGLLQHRYLDAKSHHFQRGLKLCLALEVQNRGPKCSIRVCDSSGLGDTMPSISQSSHSETPLGPGLALSSGLGKREQIIVASWGASGES